METPYAKERVSFLKINDINDISFFGMSDCHHCCSIVSMMLMMISSVKSRSQVSFILFNTHVQNDFIYICL
jgi:hypothetical protein